MAATETTVDARAEKGRALAKDRRIKKVEGSLWFVPSQSKNEGGYLVNVLAATCSCPDHETRRTRCKHQWAVEFAQTIEVAADGSATVTECVKVTRKTYTQDWPRYNAAQCAEKGAVQALLRSLCDGIVTAPHPGRGRKPLPLADAVYGMTMKVYTTVSGRRATTDLEACAAAGHMASAPHYNSISKYLEKPELTPLLTALVEESAAPMTNIESRFAVDSTGFGTVTYRRWYDAKYGREMKQAGWIKAHAIIGCTTNVIASVRITDSDANDGPQLPALVEATKASGFDMRDVTADKAYLTHRNLEAIEAVGAVPYIPFKSNSKGDGPAAWRRMFGLFMYRQADFLAHYHARSLSESAFSAIKRKFGASVRSKCFTAQTNEVLCKVLCYNLAALVHAMHQLGVEPEFPGLRTLTVAP
jgi:transposase